MCKSLSDLSCARFSATFFICYSRNTWRFTPSASDIAWFKLSYEGVGVEDGEEDLDDGSNGFLNSGLSVGSGSGGECGIGCIGNTSVGLAFGSGSAVDFIRVFETRLIGAEAAFYTIAGAFVGTDGLSVTLIFVG